MADILTDIVVDAVLTIAKGNPDQLVDLHMIEIMEMQHKSDTDSKLIKVQFWRSHVATEWRRQCSIFSCFLKRGLPSVTLTRRLLLV